MFTFKQKIPVTVVGGFLGAGKTTLVNHLIQNGNKRFGVIVNEFGDVNVDGALIENIDEEGVTEFSNGCLCCAGRDDLAEAMLKLSLRKNPPQHLLVELSGLADPVPVAQTVLEPQLRHIFDLDGIIGVADARNLYQTLQDVPEGAVQLAYASSIILNKTDLASPEQLETARALLAQLNPLGRVTESVNAVVDAATLLHQGAFDSDWQPQGHEHTHTQGVVSFSLHQATPLDALAWNAFMEEFILARPGNVFRAKGFLAFRQIPDEIIFQAVREIVKVTKGAQRHDGHSSLVVIGRGLDPEEYRTAFAKLHQPLVAKR
ncbi:MAG: CobW family GTP-binding protein [Deinococcales bacterium]